MRNICKVFLLGTWAFAVQVVGLRLARVDNASTGCHGSVPSMSGAAARSRARKLARLRGGGPSGSASGIGWRFGLSPPSATDSSEENEERSSSSIAEVALKVTDRLREVGFSTPSRAVASLILTSWAVASIVGRDWGGSDTPTASNALESVKLQLELQSLRPTEPAPLPVPKLRKKKMWWSNRRRGQHEGRGLGKMPASFLVGEDLVVRLRDRRRRRMLETSVAETLSAEGIEVTERAAGMTMMRTAQFWAKAGKIYFSYKAMQAKVSFQIPRMNLSESEAKALAKKWWDEVHAVNSDRMLELCLALRGFYLKSGQFLGTRHDFMPKMYLRKLGTLHDSVPPLPPEVVEAVIERELGGPASETFSYLNLTHPVGSASISQVHYGKLKSTGEPVAVKVQYPGAEQLMMSDLGNLKLLAGFLQRFELNFDILSSLKELGKQIKFEFDFAFEAKTLERMGKSMEKCQSASLLTLPEPRLATKRLLVMSFVEGQSLASIKRGKKEHFRSLRKRIGRQLLNTLADAWGHMVFDEGLFNADPHPGNILIMPEGKNWGPFGLALGLLRIKTPKLRVGILDWGQIKELEMGPRTKFAEMICAISSQKSDDIVSSFRELDIKLSNPEDESSTEKLALVMFDTKTIPGLDFNPFSENNVLKLNSVREYPQDLYFLLRAVLMFRGMANSLGVDFSLADRWQPYARNLVDNK
ncbi:unnamed protein product [Chrysoparadoxa australica]